FQKQMMLEAIAIRPHPAWQMRRQQPRESMETLLQPGAPATRHAPLHLRDPLLQLRQPGHPARAQVANGEEDVLAEPLSQLECAAMNVFARDRQTLEPLQDVAAQLCQCSRLIGADVENAGLLLLGEGIHPHGKYRQLSRASRRL